MDFFVRLSNSNKTEVFNPGLGINLSVNFWATRSQKLLEVLGFEARTSNPQPDSMVMWHGPGG